MSRTAVVIYNLGGPDCQEAVRPFLKNLFSDPKILRMPALLRFVLARLIAWRRTPVARKIYAEIGGKSPILPETRKQAAALQRALGKDYRVFVAMRYWHPLADAVAHDVFVWEPDKVVLVPLYPQFSSTTTESFSRIWYSAAKKAGLNVSTAALCCWPEAPGFINALSGKLDQAIRKLSEDTPYRILFSAHGLPKKIIESGDPYAHQVEQTVLAVLRRLKTPETDYVVCYQSRVGPMEWLKPYTTDEIKRAGTEGKAVIVVPIAFVSEHSETLVELDIEYAKVAKEAGVPKYVRTQTVNSDPTFIGALADLVVTLPETGTWPGGKTCPSGFGDCPHRQVGS